MNKIVTLFFVVLMLQGNSGDIMPNWTSGLELLRIYQPKCTEQHDHSFTAIIVEDRWLKNIRGIHHECTGSIIDMKWVLASSSCIQIFFDYDTFSGPKKLIILANFNEALNTFDFRLMKQFFPFKETTSGGMNANVSRHDIGLIELEQPFQQGPTMRSIRIARKGEAARCKKANILSPFLNTARFFGGPYRPPNISSSCRGASFVQKESCGTNRLSMFDAEMLCVREERKWLMIYNMCPEGTCNDTCSPVRGRPLFCKDALIGIEVGCHGEHKASDGFISFLKIEPYLDFIGSTLRNSSISGKEDNKKKKKQKKTTAKAASSRAEFLKGAVKKTNLLLITSTLFVYL